MIGIIILTSVLALIFIIVNRLSDDKYIKTTSAVLVALFSVCLGGAIETYQHLDEPKAIDVYRGNTELEITETVRDSVVVSRDTVVVFKTK